MRISTQIGLFSSNSREDHRQALLTAAASSSATSTSQLVSACARRQPLPPEEVEGDQQDAVLYHPSSGKRNLSFESSTEGAVALPAMVPAFSNISFSGATVIVNFGAGNIHHNTASNMTASNEILNQSSETASEEAAWKKLRQ